MHDLLLIIFLSTCLVIVVCDQTTKQIPDRLQILAAASWLGWRYDQINLTSILLALLFGVILTTMTLAYEKLRQKPAMGMGDIKLLFWITLGFGSQTLVILILACILAGILEVLPSMVRDQRQATLPFGPYLLTSMLLMLLSEQIYLH